jgi:hypothetical protein
MAHWSNNLAIEKIIDNTTILLTRRFRVIFLTYLNYTNSSYQIKRRKDST